MNIKSNSVKFFAVVAFVFGLTVSTANAAAYSFPNMIDTAQERMDVQTVLNMVVTPTPNLVVDGKIGAKSIAAVKAFQAMKNLVVDGKIGPMTRAALEAAQ
ncbi:MAG: peptidoglycan-binding protein, partial [Candidatus Pacebacteria bacterium]|nr:peptidoglycan-binding protein [Candidatus Paceibacterota bacterium]